jgi:hypothetical protein
MKSEEVGEKHPPYLTFCPWPIKKNSSLSYTDVDFRHNTFEITDIFSPISMANFAKDKTHTWKETKSVYYGRCYTIQKKVTVCGK